jgi:hypothetical protein
MSVLIFMAAFFLVLAGMIDIHKQDFKFVGSDRVIKRLCLLCLFLSILSFLAICIWHVAIPAREPEDKKVTQLTVFRQEMVVAGDAVPQGETGFCIVYVGELMASNKYYVLARNDQKLKPYDRVEVSTIDLPPAEKATDTDHMYPLVVSRITHRAGER